MAPIPIALYAVQLDMARKVQEALLPEYDVVHVVLTLKATEDELRPLMAGDTSVEPSSEVGSNATRAAGERLIPRVLVFSASVPDADVQAAVRAAKVPAGAYAQPDASEVRAQGSGKDPAAYARVLKTKLTGMGYK
ncbi:hypothetical protein VUR80DRAFT_10342 [Thermomyces stellatus]